MSTKKEGKIIDVTPKQEITIKKPEEIDEITKLKEENTRLTTNVKALQEMVSTMQMRINGLNNICEQVRAVCANLKNAADDAVYNATTVNNLVATREDAINASIQARLKAEATNQPA